NVLPSAGRTSRSAQTTSTPPRVVQTDFGSVAIAGMAASLSNWKILYMPPAAFTNASINCTIQTTVFIGPDLLATGMGPTLPRKRYSSRADGRPEPDRPRDVAPGDARLRRRPSRRRGAGGSRRRPGGPR